MFAVGICTILDSFSLHVDIFCPQDEEDAKAIGRLFADMGDAYVQLIATGRHATLVWYSVPMLWVVIMILVYFVVQSFPLLLIKTSF